jgi:hypothetical protein
MNMLLAIQGSSQQQTMTSREIAELTDKRHDNVMRVCTDLKESNVCPQIEVCFVINDLANGRKIQECRLSKRDSLILVARLSPEFTGRIVDRWMELETAAAVPVIVDPLASLPPEQRAMVMMMLDNVAIKARQDTQDAVQAAQAAVQATHAETLKRIESNQQAAVASVQSFTALGYSIYREIPMSKIELIRLGKRASAISKKKGITVDHVADGRHGRVGSYHVTALDEALEELMK